MSDNESKDDEKSVRVNVRIPRKQYDLLKQFGEVLGFETDGACLKHFLAIGLQASAGGVSSLRVASLNESAIVELKRMNDSVDYAKQLDLVEAAKAAS